MALTFNGINSGLSRAGNLVAAYPFTIFAWTRSNKLHVGFPAELAADPGPNGVHEGHGMLGDGSVMRAWSSTGNSVWVGAARPYSVGDWVPCMVVFAGQASRKVYYGSGPVRTDTGIAPQNPAFLNAFAIGRQAVKNANYWSGDLACVGLWNVELTAADFATLAGGAVPSSVRSNNLVDYWSLLTQAAVQTGLNGRTLAATNTAQAASHPIVEGNGDTVPPTLVGELTVSAVSGTGYTLTWPAGTDDVAVTSYERSLDAGGIWVNVGNVLTVTISGRTPGTTDQIRVRARDAGGNVSSPSLAATVTLPDTVPPTLTGQVMVSALTSTSYTLGWPAATDNVAVTAYEVSLDAGASYTSMGNVLGASVTGRAAGTTDQVRVRARDAYGNASSPPLATSVTLLPPNDATPPVLTGSITVSSLTSTGYTLGWPAASDNVAVSGYERSLDAGSTWLNVGSVLSAQVTGRTPGTTDQVRVRARDAAGNVSSPALATSVSLPSGSGRTLITPPMKNNTGTPLANLSGLTVNVYNASTGVLVVRKTGLSSDAAGVVSLTDAAFVAGTSYAYEVVTPSHGRRLPVWTAT
jgi:hypothetical protein